MAETLSFTPNRPADDRAARPVRRRHVLYVPGYDPEAESRSRMIFVRELLRYAKRFGLVERSIGPVEPCPEIPALRWNVTAAKAGWRTETVVEVLRWDDIVIRDFARPLPLAAALLFTAFLHSIAAGTLFRFFRLNWKFGGVIVYPPVMVATTLGLGALLGAALARLLALWVPLPGWAGLAAALAGALGGLKLAGPLGRRWFVWHLTHDWVFNWQHGIGRRADYEARVERFSRRIRDVVQAGEADEIVVLGHSSGAIMAVEAVADALALDPESFARAGGCVGLLTLGSCLPLVAVNPHAHRCRERIRRLVASPALLWVDYQAPQDWLNFAGFNPVRDLPLGITREAAANPVIRSSRFKDILTPETYRSILFKPFRLHFQFLMGAERLGEYDYVMAMVGPVSLAERVRLGDGVVALAHPTAPP